MTSIQTSISRVRRRVFANRLLANLGWAVFAGLFVSCLVLIADKLMPLTDVPMWVYYGIGGLGVAVAVGLAFGKLPDEADAAVLLDEKLKLQDKLGTAMYTARLQTQNELTEQIAREAEEAGQRARTMLGQAAPIQLAKVWNWTPIMAAVLLGVLFLMPANAGDPLGQVAAAEEQAKAQELAEKGAEVIINTVQQDLSQDEDEDGEQKIASGLPDELQDQLVSISDEIRKNPRAAVEKLKEAESLISDAEDRLGEQVDVVEAAFNPLKNDATALDAGQPGPADEFTKAMNRGDFEKAKDAIEKLQEQIDKGEFDQKTQQQLQQQLNNLANQLNQQAQQAQQRQQQAQQQAQQNLQQQLQNSGMSQQQAQQMAQQMSQQMQQQAQQNQQGQQGQQGQNQQGQNQQGQQNQQAQGNRQQGQQGQQGQQQSQQQMQQQLSQALQQQGMSQQQANQQAQQMMQQMQQQMQQSQGQGQSSGTQQQLSQGLQQMAGQCNKPGGQQGQGQQGQQGQQGGQSAQQAINQMAQMQQQLQRMQQQQAQMQQAMNQINQAQQGGQQGQGQQGQQAQGQGGGQGQGAGTGDGGNPYGPLQPGYQHTSYAANDIQQGEGRVIASWTENGEAAAGEATVEFNASRTEAVQSAERAVTEDRVPRRYHESIKEYFKQLPEDPDAGRAPAAPR